MTRNVPLSRKKSLDRSSKLRVRSKNKKAVTRASLGRALAKWCRHYGECVRCGAAGCDLEAHHVYTRGSTPCLKLCPDNLIPLCRACHGFAHSEPGKFEVWLESLKPGLLSHLCQLARSQKWQKRDLDEIEAEFKALPCFRDYFARRVA